MWASDVNGSVLCAWLCRLSCTNASAPSDLEGARDRRPCVENDSRPEDATNDPVGRFELFYRLSFDVDEDSSRTPASLAPSLACSSGQPVHCRRDTECGSVHLQYSQCSSDLRQADRPGSSGQPTAATPPGIRRSRISRDTQARPTPTTHREAASSVFLYQSTVLQSSPSPSPSTVYLRTHTLLPLIC